jgi:hypothetical protein
VPRSIGRRTSTTFARRTISNRQPKPHYREISLDTEAGPPAGGMPQDEKGCPIAKFADATTDCDS